MRYSTFKIEMGWATGISEIITKATDFFGRSQTTMQPFQHVDNVRILCGFSSDFLFISIVSNLRPLSGAKSGESYVIFVQKPNE